MVDIFLYNKDLHKFEIRFIILINLINFICLLLLLFGFFNSQPYIILDSNSIFKIIISLFLIYRFSKYRKQPIKFTDLDRKLCYSIGIYIFLVSVIDIIGYNLLYARNSLFFPLVQPVLNYITLIKNDYLNL
jgi:hypothetical protein